MDSGRRKRKRRLSLTFRTVVNRDGLKRRMKSTRPAAALHEPSVEHGCCLLIGYDVSGPTGSRGRELVDRRLYLPGIWAFPSSNNWRRFPRTVFLTS